MWSALSTGCHLSRTSAMWRPQRRSAPSSSGRPQPRYIHIYSWLSLRSLCPFGVFFCSIDHYLIILWYILQGIHTSCADIISLCKCTGLYKFHSKSFFLSFFLSFQHKDPEVHHLRPISGVWEDGTQSGESGKSTYTTEIGTEMKNLRAQESTQEGY